MILFVDSKNPRLIVILSSDEILSANITVSFAIFFLVVCEFLFAIIALVCVLIQFSKVLNLFICIYILIIFSFELSSICSYSEFLTKSIVLKTRSDLVRQVKSFVWR